MSLLGTRDDLERMLARALTRAIGYTSGAYELARIVSTVSFFAERPSAYKQELVAYLQERGSSDQDPPSKDYLADVLSFALSMGLIEVVSGREAALSRLTATQLGRALAGAAEANDERFYRYFTARIVVLADADYLVPLLSYYGHTDNRPSLFDHFLSFQHTLRERRKSWLLTAFPERMLLERMVARIPWLTIGGRERAISVEPLTQNTARHHMTPRRGWLVQLGCLEGSEPQSLTSFGHDVLRSLLPSDEYFWLGPHHDVQVDLAIAEAHRQAGPFEDTYNFASDLEQPTRQQVGDLVEQTADVMIKGYRGAKLVHAPQASLTLPIEYVNYASYRDRCAYVWQEVLEQLFQVKRGVLERFSARKGQVGFYRPVGG